MNEVTKLPICPLCGEVECSVFCCQHVKPADSRIDEIEFACWAAYIRASWDGQAKPVLDNIRVIVVDIFTLIRCCASYELIACRYNEWRQWLSTQPTGVVLRTERELEQLTTRFARFDGFTEDEEEKLVARLRCDLIASGAVREV